MVSVPEIRHRFALLVLCNHAHLYEPGFYVKARRRRLLGGRDSPAQRTAP
jgi:hypothetical protein